MALLGIGVAVGWFANSSPSPASTINANQRTEATATYESRPVFMLLGDSLTQYGGDPAAQGWGTRLQQAHIRSVDVLNRGLTSYNTKAFLTTAMPVFSKELETRLSPALITLWLGTNDAIIDGPGVVRHVPVDQYKANLVEIISRLRALAPLAKILVITPGVIDDETRVREQLKWGWSTTPVHATNERSGQYAAACASATKFLGNVTTLDLYTYLMKTYPEATDRAKLLVDGMHLSGEGNRVVYEQIQKQIAALLPASLTDTPQVP